MKTIQIALFVLTSLMLATARGEDAAGAKDLDQMQGEWTLVSGIADGMPIPDGMGKQMKRICKGDQLTTMMGTQVFFKATISLDSSKNPRTIDFQMTEGPTKGKTQLGIYEIEGDKLKSCFSAPGDPRPTDFTTKPGDHKTCTIWQRSAPATQPVQK